MKTASVVAIVVLMCLTVHAQRTLPVKSDLQRLVETEKEFARAASEKGTKAAFLSFLADDGIVFNPTEINGKLYWKNRPDSPALLSWNPVWADVSSNGNFGYTTGGWEFRPKGKNDKPTGFGEYATIWEKQASGEYRALLDIGISHSSSNLSKAGWRSPSDAGLGQSHDKPVDEEILNSIFSNKSMANGYFNYLADDAILLRDGNLPFSGRKAAFLGMERMEKEFPDSSFLKFSANTSKIYGNMMYVWGVYSLTHKDKSVTRWNFAQVWKRRAGKWQIVLDVFNKIGE